MKNKKLIILISIFVFVVLIVVLGSTLFTVRNVELNWLSSTNKLNATQDYTSTINMPIGSSVFFVDKTDIVEDLEQKHPYLKVVSVETVFPNKLRVHIAERQSLFAICLNDSTYVVLDEEMKVLEFVDKVTYNGFQKTARPILVDLSETAYLFSEDDFILGKVFESEVLTESLKKLAYSFQVVGYDAFTSKGLFSSVTLKVGIEQTLSLKTEFGIDLVVRDSVNYLSEKLNLGIAVYNEWHDKGVTNGKITCYIPTGTEKINAVFSVEDL